MRLPPICRAVTRTVSLPPEISDFEQRHLKKFNRIGAQLIFAHVPLLALLAWINDTGPVLALTLSGLVAVGPALSRRAIANPRATSITLGFVTMLMGGLLVHFGQGPAQIEMHFYFFAALALLSVFANPMVIVVAAATVAAHHLILWTLLPSSVFNYDAPFWVVGVHAAFVVVESIATGFIARAFYDNVIGMERMVENRTAELDARTQEMRTVLDNVTFGFLLVDSQLRVLEGHSRSCTDLLGIEPSTGAPLTDHLCVPPESAAQVVIALEQIFDDLMPEEVTLAQVPKRLAVGGTELHLDARAVRKEGMVDAILLSITDVTSLREEERLSTERKALIRILHQREAFTQFADDAVETLNLDAAHADQVTLRRALHTIKGNAASWNLEELVECAHEAESQAEVSNEELASVRKCLKSFLRKYESLLSVKGPHRRDVHRVDADVLQELEELVKETQEETSVRAWIQRVERRPAQDFLGPLHSMIHRVSRRLGKKVEFQIHGSEIPVHPQVARRIFPAIPHLIRNALDHGIEPSYERGEKPERGSIELRIQRSEDQWSVSVVDDGRGMNGGALATRAVRILGVEAIAELDAKEQLMLAFRDEVSTADSVSDLSGRGVGLSAVAALVHEVGGSIDVESDPQGTRITLSLPNELPESSSATQEHCHV